MLIENLDFNQRHGTVMESYSVLVIEDDVSCREMTTQVLVSQGYMVVSVERLEQARSHLRHWRPDIILIDLELPDGDGLSFVKDLGSDPGCGIIIITRDPDQTRKIQGLNDGADDFITKPFDPGELLARVTSLLRRLPARNERECASNIRLNGWFIDRNRRKIISDGGKEESLTPSELIVLIAFVNNQGVVMNRDELMAAVNRHSSHSDRTIDVLVARIRRKIISISGRNPLLTIYGAGYVFNQRENL